MNKYLQYLYDTIQYNVMLYVQYSMHVKYIYICINNKNSELWAEPLPTYLLPTPSPPYTKILNESDSDHFIHTLNETHDSTLTDTDTLHITPSDIDTSHSYSTDTNSTIDFDVNTPTNFDTNMNVSYNMNESPLTPLQTPLSPILPTTTPPTLTVYDYNYNNDECPRKNNNNRKH